MPTISINILQEKHAQASALLPAFGLDLWLTFVRETSLRSDPSLSSIYPGDVTWQSAFLFSAQGGRIAIVGTFDVENIQRVGVFTHVIGYYESIQPALVGELQRLAPRTVAVNTFRNDPAADGLSAAMFLVDDAGRVVHVNASGYAMLRDATVLRSVGNKLVPTEPKAALALSDVFAVAGKGDRFAAWFADLSRDGFERVGGKGANLGELTGAGFAVPPGFVVTARAYLDALDRAGIRARLRRRVAEADVDDPAALGEVAAACQDDVRAAGMPDEVRRAVVEGYHRLAGGAAVAVRSSATAEDTASTSFAGMNETYTNVSGDDELVARVVDCWASLWSPRVVAYRATQGLDAEPAIAVVVQEMVDAHRSGVMFTADPATGDRDRVVVEAAYGLGEVVVGGQVEPDTYVVAKDGPRLVHQHLGVKADKIVRGLDGHDQRVAVPEEERARRVLDEDVLLELVRTGMEIERHYGRPQDVEFAIVGDGDKTAITVRAIVSEHLVALRNLLVAIPALVSSLILDAPGLF